ncbi:regulatory protein RecX [Cohnella soli]|uniref:Regulatory protein RecX n=1 Tax=Cohnella soli TaxID=425005 RepID=A0ABW0HLE9_9BACL
MFERRAGTARGTVNNKRKKKAGRGRQQEEEKKPAEIAAPVVGAEVSGVDPHPRKAGMYRITLFVTVEGKVEPDSDSLDEDSGYSSSDAANGTMGNLFDDWNSEVDALIAEAKTAAEEKSGSVLKDQFEDTRLETIITVHEDTLVGWRLLKGRKLTAEEYDELKREERKEEAYRSALQMLETKARTTAELARALKRKGYEADVAAACVDRLRERRVIDDAAYAKRFAEQRVAGHRKGRMLIRQELLQRGVARSEVDSAIGGLDSNVEQEAANQLASKKWQSTKGEIRERKMKVMGMLLRRGYSNSVAREAVNLAAEAAAQEAADESYEEWQDGYDGTDDRFGYTDD